MYTVTIMVLLQEAAFAYIHQIMSGDERYSEAEREEVERATMEHLEVVMVLMSVASSVAGFVNSC